jgi:hypothetical protein
LSSLTLVGSLGPDGPDLTPAGFDKLFGQNEGTFGRNLKYLDITLKEYHNVSLGRALERCAELEELHLTLRNIFVSDFRPMNKLRTFDLKALRDPHHPIDFDMLESIRANYPCLTSLR